MSEKNFEYYLEMVRATNTDSGDKEFIYDNIVGFLEDTISEKYPDEENDINFEIYLDDFFNKMQEEDYEVYRKNHKSIDKDIIKYFEKDFQSVSIRSNKVFFSRG